MKKQEFTVTRTQVECIKIVGSNGSFATITLDYSGNKGRISIACDGGNWSNYWGSCGSSFKEFLIGLDMYYFAGKIGEDRYFDYESTLKQLKTRIKEYTTDKEERRDLLEEWDKLEHCVHKEEFVMTIMDCDKIMKMEDGCPNLNYSVSPGFKYFWDNLWPVFIDEIKKELEGALSV